MYVLQTISKLANAATVSTIVPNTSTSPIPSFAPRQSSPPKPIPLSSILHNPSQAYIAPHHARHTIALSIELPPASSASPPTPTGIIDDGVKIVSHERSPGMPISAHAAMEYASMKQKMFAFVAGFRLYICPFLSMSFFRHQLL